MLLKNVSCFVLSVIVFFVSFAVLGFAQNTFGQSFDYPLIFDWHVAPVYAGKDQAPLTTAPYGFHAIQNDITPIPLPGSGYVADNPRIQGSLSASYAHNRPVGVLLTNWVGPVHGWGDRNALPTVMNYLDGQSERLDYIFMDIEPYDGGAQASYTWDMCDADVLEVVSLNRSHSNPDINQARIGSYHYYPGVYNEAAGFYPDDPKINRADRDSFYRSSGLDVAMPFMYPYSAYKVHATTSWVPESRAVNTRQAVFWGPLEFVSVAARDLPEGHQLIPWISPYIEYEGLEIENPADIITHEDSQRLLQHARLRGADGYYGLSNADTTESWYDPAYPTDTRGAENFKAHTVEAWTELDWLFAGVGAAGREVLNLNTDKTVGFEWSAVETNNGAAVLLSNLGNSSHYFAFSELVTAGMSQQYVDELGGAGVSVNVGDHLLLTAGAPELPAVHYTFKETAPGTWEVLVEVTGDSTAGLSGYEIWVDGVEPASVSFAENNLGSGFASLVQGDIGGNFNAGNYQGISAAIEGIGMVAVDEAGVVLDVPALLGTLSTEDGLTEEDFRVMVVGLLNELGDGFYDADDIVPALEVIPFVALLLGDANNDGVVSAGDYAAVQANFGNVGEAGGGLLGDANGDGVVSAGDYAAVQANFGNTTATSVVPEPATTSLLVMGGIALLSRRKPQRL